MAAPRRTSRTWPNADCIVIQGSNMAECHPVGFQWVMEAKRRGATVIHVDPRFTRTSAVADMHVPMRAGTDIAFLGGLSTTCWSNEHGLPRVRRGLHERARDPARGLPGHRGPRRPVLRLGPREARLRHDTWEYEGAEAQSESGDPSRPHWRGPAQRRRTPADRPRGVLRQRRGDGGSQAGARRHAAASALRVPGAQAALRALHAGDGRRRLRRHPGAVPRGRRRR